VLRLEGLPIAMETFSAQSGQPASECTRMAGADAVVVRIVAHHYGYVPPRKLGGDGERSLTWLEVDPARRARKHVFAFLVDSMNSPILRPALRWEVPPYQERQEHGRWRACHMPDSPADTVGHRGSFGPLVDESPEGELPAFALFGNGSAQRFLWGRGGSCAEQGSYRPSA
jgi:hypothetical protein